MRVHIVYETHSLSVDNERGIGTGWLDGALSEEGREHLLERTRLESLVGSAFDWQPGWEYVLHR